MAETELQSLVDLNKQIEEVRLNSRLQAELRTRHFEEQKLHSQYLEKQLLEMKEILISMAVRDRGQTSSSKNPAQNSPSTLVSQLHSTMNPPLTDPFRSGQLTANRNQQVASGESSRFELKDDPISTKEPSDRIAHQVLDKMPELFADKINLEIAHVSSIEELHGLEAFGNDVREQVVWALGNNAGDSPQCRDLARQGGELMPHLTQINEHTDLINLPSVLETKEIVTNYIDELCFDPGGEEILYAFDSLDWCRVDIKLSDVPAMTNDDCLLGKRVRNREVLNQVEESAQVRIKEEPNIVKERSDLTAHQVLDEMPKSIVDELDFKITLGSLAEELDDMKDFEVSDLNHVTSLSLVENMAADLVRFLRKPPNQEEIVMDYIGVLCFDPGGNFVGVLLERHTVDYDLSCNCCLNPIEWVNWVAYMLRAHTTEDVVKCELLKCFDMKGCLISIFLDNKILSDKHSSYFVTTFLSSKWVGNSVTSKEVWKSLAKRYLMIVDNKEFASDKYWKYDMGTTLWCWETHDYLFHFANSLVNLEPSSSKEKNGDATQGLEGSDVESVSDTIDMENSYADVGSLFGIAPKTCFSIMHLGEGHYSVALYCRRNHQIPENTSYLEVAPALAADCAAILKHSELASLTCLELGQVCKDVGLPAGVLNILTSLGPEVGAPLASHPVVDKIAFTGSNATGSKIMSSASQVVKPVTMELGGKSLIIVFEDADLDKAVEWTAFGCFRTNGQICSATSRLIVHENIATAVVHGHREGRILIFIFDPGGIVKLNTQSGWRLSPTEFFMALLLRFLYAYIIQFMILGDKDHLKEGVLLQDYRGLGWFYYYRPGFSYFF